MLHNRLARTLFKSLLKWNRRPEVCGSRFTIDPNAIGISPLLPPSITVLNGAEDVQGAIFHSFRRLRDDNNNAINNASPAAAMTPTQHIDLGFRVLKQLNETGIVLKEKFDAREERHSYENPLQQHLIRFRVGQVVQHNDMQFRGIVVGWRIDPEQLQQEVEVLPDTHDYSEFTRFRQASGRLQVVSSDQLTLQRDSALTRIFNNDIPLYFDGFNASLARYIPNEELLCWYGGDFEPIRNTTSSVDLGTDTEEGVSFAAGVSDAVPRKLEIDDPAIVQEKLLSWMLNRTGLLNADKESSGREIGAVNPGVYAEAESESGSGAVSGEEFKQSVRRVHRGVRRIGLDLLSVLQRHAPHLSLFQEVPLSTPSDPLDPSSYPSRVASESSSVQPVAGTGGSAAPTTGFVTKLTNETKAANAKTAVNAAASSIPKNVDAEVEARLRVNGSQHFISNAKQTEKVATEATAVADGTGGDSDATIHADTVINEQVICDQVLNDVVQAIKLCAYPERYGAVSDDALSVMGSITGSMSQSGTTTAGITTAAHLLEEVTSWPNQLRSRSSIAQPLRRGGVWKKKTSFSLNPLAESGVLEYYHGVHEREIERAYYALGYLTNCLTSVDQLLQLRFQHSGIAYHDGLYISTCLNNTLSSSTNHNNASKAGGGPTSYRADGAPSGAKDTREIADSHNSSLSGSSSSSSRGASSMLSVYPADKQVADWVQKTARPGISLDVGQIVRHKQFGYRGVVCGVELRPPFNMARWEGIQNLELGQEQPIYRVVPDEGDVEGMLGAGSFREFYYVAQENLELVASPEEKLVHHRSLNNLFLGFDIATGEFRVPHKLRYCFPTARDRSDHVGNHQQHQQQVTSDSISTSADGVVGLSSDDCDDIDADSMRTLARKVLQEQQLVYTKIDALLVDLLVTLRSSLALSRREYLDQLAASTSSSSSSSGAAAAAAASPSVGLPIQQNGGSSRLGLSGSPDGARAPTIDSMFGGESPFRFGNDKSATSTTATTTTNGTAMDDNSKTGASARTVLLEDVQVLMRGAVRREHSQYAQSLLYMIWLTHEQPDINKLMRLTVWNAQRGNVAEAAKMGQRAIELDPHFAEGYHKMASYNHLLGNSDECISYAKEALARFPSHFGALTASALAHERLGDKHSAALLLRMVLALDPWAAHIPTVLISIEDAIANDRKLQQEEEEKKETRVPDDDRENSEIVAQQQRREAQHQDANDKPSDAEK